jgi:hypothetical protein
VLGQALGEALGEAAVDTRRASSHLFRGSSLDLEPWARSDRFAVGGDFAVASAGAGARLSARGVYADAVDRDNWDHAAQGLAMPDRLPIRETVTAIAARGEGALALAQRLNPENPYAAMAQLAASGQIRFSSSANRWNLREGAIYTSDLSNYADDTLSQMAGDARRWVSGEGRVDAARAQAALAARAVAAQSAPSMVGGTFFDAAEGLGPTLQEQLQQPRQMYASAQGLSKALVELQDGWQEFGVKLGAYAQRNDTWMGKAAHIAGAAVYISGAVLPTSAGELAATVLLMGPGGRVVSAGLGRAVAGLEGLAARSGLTGLLDAAAQRTGMAYAQTARWVQDATRSVYAGAVDYLAPKVEHFLYRTGAVQYVVEPGAARFAQRVAVDGVEGVAANRGVPQAVELTFDKSTRTWTTPAGLDYGLGSEHGNRIKHVLAHTAPNPNKTMHSVFNVDRKQVLGLVDEAWIARSNPLPNDPGAYVVPMGRIVGTAGETNIKIIMRPGTTKIITAYPLQ